MTEAASALIPGNDLGREQVQACLREVEEILDQPRLLQSPEDIEELEHQCARLCDNLLANIVGAVLQCALDSTAVEEKTRRLARETPKRLKPADIRSVHVQFLRDPRVQVTTLYYRRRKGNILHRAKGLFPALVVLGFHEHASSGATSQIARTECAMYSLEEAAAWLRDTGGLIVGVKTITRIARRFGQRSRSALPAHLQIATAENAGIGERRTLVISVDGGRLRIRRNKRGPPSPKGRRRYHTDWREPLLLYIYMLKPNGSVDRSFTPPD